MLSELHFAISKYYSDEADQSIYHLKATENGKSPAYFQLKSNLTNPSDLVRKIRDESTRPVILFHKLWGSNCEPMSLAAKGVAPFFILNHTQGCSAKGVGKADGIIGVSRHMLKWMQQKFPRHRKFFVRNGVNQCRYDEVSAGIDPLDGFFITGRMNNLNNCKHPLDWIKFCNGIRLPKPLWHDYLGGGIHLNESQKQASKHRSKNPQGNVVNLPGRVDDFNAKISHLKRWDIFFYEIPGIEGTSMSLLEALACGVPALINNKPGNSEIIDRDANGIVYKDRAEAVAVMTSLCKDEKYLKQLSSSTKKHFAKHLDAKHSARKYIDIFKEIA